MHISWLNYFWFPISTNIPKSSDAHTIKSNQIESGKSSLFLHLHEKNKDNTNILRYINKNITTQSSTKATYGQIAGTARDLTRLMGSKSVNCTTLDHMIASSNGSIFGVTGPLCREFTGYQWITLTKASDAELWCFLWSAPEQAVEQTMETPVIWYAHYDVTVMICKKTYTVAPWDIMFNYQGM